MSTPETELTCTCAGHNKGPHGYHFAGCPMREHPDSLRAMLKIQEAKVEHYGQVAARWIELAQRWEGKFHALKRENNALRKKLYPNK